MKLTAILLLCTCICFGQAAPMLATYSAAVDNGSQNASAISLSPCPMSLPDGMPLIFRAAYANTSTAPTLSVCGLSATTITRPGGSALNASDIVVGTNAYVTYNLSGTRWELQNPQTQAAAPSVAGMIFMIVSGSCPSWSTQVTALAGQMLYGTTAANGDVGTTGGSNSITPTGTNGTAVFTPVGTNASVNFTPVGTVANGSIAWPSGTPTIAAGTFTQPTFTGNAGTIPAETISWPAGVPAFSGSSGTVPAETFTGSAMSMTIVTGEYNSGTTGYAPKSIGGTTLASGTTSVTAGTPAGTNGTVSFTPAGTIAWPAGVPTNATVSFTPAGSNSGGAFAEGAISWPSGTPTPTAGAFTGSQGTVPAQTFTGTQGTIPAETFIGNAFDPHPAYTKVIFCSHN